MDTMATPRIDTPAPAGIKPPPQPSAETVAALAEQVRAIYHREFDENQKLEFETDLRDENIVPRDILEELLSFTLPHEFRKMEFIGLLKKSQPITFLSLATAIAEVGINPHAECKLRRRL